MQEALLRAVVAEMETNATPNHRALLAAWRAVDKSLCELETILPLPSLRMRCTQALYCVAVELDTTPPSAGFAAWRALDAHFGE